MTINVDPKNSTNNNRGNPHRSSLSVSKQTAVTEGFYRHWSGGPPTPGDMSSSGQQHHDSVVDASPLSAPVVGLSQIIANNNLSPLIHEPAKRRRSFNAHCPVQPEAMDDRAGGLDATGIRAGTLRSPGELGVDHLKQGQEKQQQQQQQILHSDDNATSSNNNNNLPVHAHPETIRHHQRTQQSIQRGKLLESALAEHLEQQQKRSKTNPQPRKQVYSCVTSFCFNGMEVLIGSTSFPVVYVISARSRMVLQTLDLPLRRETKTSNDVSINVISIQSNPLTGQVCIALSNGMVQTYVPHATDPKEVCYGRYRWRNGPSIDCVKIFYREDERNMKFVAFSRLSLPGERLDISMASDGKILVAHRDQLAVFEGGNVNDYRIGQKQQNLSFDWVEEADLLWTTQLPGKVVTAKISGDGQSIAFVLDSSKLSVSHDLDDESADSDGVHTYERDWDDGSSSPDASRRKPSLVRVRSSGILYKPGRFLVHTAPVTRISFRGLGHNTSSAIVGIGDKDGKGNDLLLTYCTHDCSARIYDQSGWTMLTEWTTLPRTRVDWIKGISAFTMGDLETTKKSKRQRTAQSSAPPVAVERGGGDSSSGGISRPYSPALSDDSGPGEAGNESVGKMLRFQGIHHNQIPSSNAGAWVSEITFYGKYPSIRLSRLTYLKRGVDDWNPTLFESLSSFLPPGCVFRGRILDTDESGFSIEGIWPAWNPWLSESPNLSSTDKDINNSIRGSAMAFLGLSSGPSVSGGGHFGDSLLGGTQNPPGEVRIVASHPNIDTGGGNVAILEFPIFGDHELTSLELGHPIRSVLSLSHLDALARTSFADTTTTFPSRTDLPGKGLDYDNSRLVAEVGHNRKSVLLTWRQQGAFSFLPWSWTPADVDVKQTAQQLKEADKLRDETALPVPLALPPIYISPEMAEKETITAVLWWHDKKFGGAPLLVAVMDTGTVIVYEIPPPWAALEPTLPALERPPQATVLFDTNDFSPADLFHDNNEEPTILEYEVSITPDPEYGLGLRLESQIDGRCAIAGSYKRHPLNGDILPAEKSGMISLGDKLLRANDIDLANKPFDDIVTAVREVGASCGPGNPIRMKFRRITRESNRLDTDSLGSDQFLRRQGSFSSSLNLDSSHGRRSMEQINGISPERLAKKSPHTGHKRTRTPSKTQIIAPKYPNALSTMLGVFPQAISVPVVDGNDIQSLLFLLPFSVKEETAINPLWQTALLFSSIGNGIVLSLLAVSTDVDQDKARMVEVGSFDYDSASKEDRRTQVCAMHVLESSIHEYQIICCDRVGQVSLLHASLKDLGENILNLKVDIRCYFLFRLQRPWTPGFMFRAYSAALIVTAHPDEEDGRVTRITVWSANPGPGNFVNQGGTGTLEYPCREYGSTEIRTDLMDGNALLDFSFLNFGFLDSAPALVMFTCCGASLVCKKGPDVDWRPCLQISYCSLLGSSIVRKVHQDEMHLISKHTSPRDIFCHLIPGFCAMYNSFDETSFLRSDWYPEAVLAHACTDHRGVEAAIRDGLSYLFLWLCSEGQDIPEDHLECPLAVSPLPIVEDNSCNNTDSTGTTSASAFMASLSPAPNRLNVEEKASIRELQQVIQEYLSKGTNKGKSRDKENEIEIRADIDLPPVLGSLDDVDLRLLWALMEVVLCPPTFDSIDTAGQLFLFADCLFKTISQSPEIPSEKSKPTLASAHSFLVKRSTPTSDFTEKKPSISSAGVLAALVSSKQSQLLNSIRLPGQKLSWTRVAQLRIPFWERSDSVLAKLSEEVGQCLFRENRDIMDCAIFFLIARKRRTLRNLAATDQSDMGRTFFNFITTHDFSSKRGRQAAEKNAYSLLRKNRYKVAAAFFLLPEPPQLKSCLEIIATKMQDIDLAFLVARLIESPELQNSGESFSGAFNSGAMGGFGGGMLGSGGGYALSGSYVPDVSDPVKFADWTPCLGKETRLLLIDRILPVIDDDNALSATAIIWLGNSEEASWVLAGRVETAFGSKHLYEIVDNSCYKYFRSLLAYEDSKTRRSPLAKANTVVDFASVPCLLTWLNASSRVKNAAVLTVANAFKSRGVELAAIRTLVNFFDASESEKTKSVCKQLKPGSVESTQPLRVAALANLPSASSDNLQPSSIFDDFSVPQRANVNSPVSEPILSSIFDEFSVPTTKSKPAIAPPPALEANRQPSSAMQSSIFDNFDVPPVAQKPKILSPAFSLQTAPRTGTMQSSIFDTFDVPPVARHSKNPANADDVETSIFDNFDIPPAVRKYHATVDTSSTQNPSAGVHSSIFDSFDDFQCTTTTTPVTSSLVAGKRETSILKEAKIERQDTEESVAVEVNISFGITQAATPDLWNVWKKSLLLHAAARRLLREIASVLAQFHGDPVDPQIDDFYSSRDLLVSPRVSEVLQLPCDSQRIQNRILQSFEELCTAGALPQDALLNHSLHLLGHFSNHRPVFSVVLLSALGRWDLAEELVRTIASSLIQRCRVSCESYDSIAHEKKTRCFVSSQFIRRDATRLSLQLESCLWLHRGGGLRLSGLALNEAIVAVRVGLLVSSWNRNFKCLEAIIKNDPDCSIDEEAGRKLWTSLKVINQPKKDTKSKKTTSGGWEFLVNCKRSQATELLRDRPTGSFIIRPHPEDVGVFTISFKTNLVPGTPRVEVNGRECDTRTPETSGDELSDVDTVKPQRQRKKHIRKDDVVQHAIIRLSDSGFRCGSFGPFASLMSLLEAVSNSLPFKLRFDLPPRNRVIKEEGFQTSPNAVFLRRLVFNSTGTLASNPPHFDTVVTGSTDHGGSSENRAETFMSHREDVLLDKRQASLCLFLDLMVLSLVVRQLSAVASAEFEDKQFDKDDDDVSSQDNDGFGLQRGCDGIESQFAVAQRVLRPLLTWCRSVEIAGVYDMAPSLERLSVEGIRSPSDSVTQLEDAIEVSPTPETRSNGGADAILRKMIQQSSGLDFSTLRLVDGGECTMVVLFSKQKAIQWLLSNGRGQSEADALAWLERMEEQRMIEPVNLSNLPMKNKGTSIVDHGIRYRFVDPWEVEALQNREGETRSASLGRERFLGFNVGQVTVSTESVFRSLGGVPLLELWTTVKGAVFITKALASVHPPWERDAGGDLHVTNRTTLEPPPFVNSIRQYLYRNTLFRRLELPQRFLALVQVELLDLKNLTIPGGSLSLTAYALLRLKRAGSGSVLTNKARTLDSTSTIPMKLNKTSGPNAPASWGSVVRFRFPLPEDVSVDGVSYDDDRDVLFKGPPSVLQVSVYEKKLLVDHALGRADITTDGLWAGGQLEEWVPLRSEKRGIKWFARIRLTLRFELMCLASPEESKNNIGAVPSAGLKRIEELCNSGGSAHEDIQKRSLSSPDLIGYFEGMLDT